MILQAMPTSSPTCRGYVEWESKRGKWTKRWMELREQSLWLAKRDTVSDSCVDYLTTLTLFTQGKDEIHLCSLSNFDAYSITRKYKSPKSFVFAVKSTDNLSFFENAADYVHYFSCGTAEGEQWMKSILLARVRRPDPSRFPAY
jgi:hypothetical protein